jgi:ketosteroid isomerase-like protein
MTINASEQPEGSSRRRTWRGAARALLAVAIVGTLTVSAAQDLPGLPLPHWLGVDQVLAQADQTAAIQQVIQNSNAEQVQAIAAQDPSAMADTVTPDHYQQLQQINQDLLSSGVTGINLVNLEWGPIAVSGSTASVTTYETWSTTYTDGSTEQSRDQNAYTLVLSDGAWKIASDDHPQAAGVSPASAPASPPASSTPPSSDLGVSHNWAGYAATGGGYTAVSGTWTVPDFSANSPQGVDATWVGIGGVNTRDLIQAGTQEQTSGSGQTQYSAWIEMLPQASRPVPLSVRPGDSVSVSINEQGANSWLIAFKNNTTGQTLQQNVQYASSHSSAEWIEEAPSSGRGILPLDNFGMIQFSNATTVKNGQSEDIAAAGAQPISLIGATQQPLAVPSSLGADGQSFSVSRTATAATPAGVTTLRPRRNFGN